MPVAHGDVDASSVKFLFEELTLRGGPLCKVWRLRAGSFAEADLGVAVLEFFDDFVRERAAACHLAEVFCHFAEDIRRSMR